MRATRGVRLNDRAGERAPFAETATEKRRSEPGSGPAGHELALALQRSAGNAAVARLLARRDGRVLARDDDTELLDPTAENPYGEPTAEERAEAARQQSARRDNLLSPLEAHDSITFLSRLRALDAVERLYLESDSAFMEGLRRRIGSGSSYWIVRLILHYGHPLPANVRAIHQAVLGGDAGRVIDLIRADQRIRDVVGLRDVLPHKFSGRELGDILAWMNAPAETGRAEVSANWTEAHYEGGQVVAFGGRTRYTLVRTGNALRVIVRIRLVEHSANTRSVITDKLVARWRRSIDRYWNNRFQATNGPTVLTISFLPLFVYNSDDNPHFTVNVKEGSGRANVSNWQAEDDEEDTAAHEFGHMIGNPDEYNLPGTAAEIPTNVPVFNQPGTTRTMTAAERQQNTWQGLTGETKPVNTAGYDMPNLMGSGGLTLVRHVQPIVTWYNANLKPASEPAFAVRFRP
jgi:hypothetical protein